MFQLIFLGAEREREESKKCFLSEKEKSRFHWMKWMRNVWMMLALIENFDMGSQSWCFLFQNNSWYKLMTAGFWISWICWIPHPTTSANLKCSNHNFKLILTIELQDKKFEGLRNFWKATFHISMWLFSFSTNYEPSVVSRQTKW